MIENKRVLLIMLPFWDQQIPPLGISCIKHFVENNSDFSVKTIDLNTNIELYNCKKEYFNVIEKIVPKNKRLHLYNIGMEVLSEHMMAYVFCKNEKEFIDVICNIFYNTLFHNILECDAYMLNNTIAIFFNKLNDFIISQITNCNPSRIGFSVNKGSFAASMFAAKLIKEKFPNIEIIFGGPTFSTDLQIGTPNYLRFIENSQNIDKIIIGEGEQLFLKLLKGELPLNQKVYTQNDISNNSKIMVNAFKPDFSDYDLDSYLYISSFASRSCPFQCSFCSETVFWGEYRKKDINIVITELIDIYTKNQKQLVYMCDSLLNPIINDLSYEFFKNEIPAYFDGYFRIDKQSGNLENTISWRKGGFYRARLGVESGSEKILDLMNKKISLLEIKKSIINLAKAGIKTTTMWVVGHPEETEEDFMATLKLIEELQDYIYEADCNPFVYYFSGQVDSDKWAKHRVTLYPERFNNFLLMQKWTLNCYPYREEVYKRVNRFIAFCRSIGVPNPYSLKETYEADNRWKSLHRNAVPNIVDFGTNKLDFKERFLVRIFSEGYNSDINIDSDNWD